MEKVDGIKASLISMLQESAPHVTQTSVSAFTVSTSYCRKINKKLIPLHDTLLTLSKHVRHGTRQTRQRIPHCSRQHSSMINTALTEGAEETCYEESWF
jgi:hypothetical protein